MQVPVLLIIVAIIILAIVAPGLGIWLLTRNGKSPDDALAVLSQAQPKRPMVLTPQWFQEQRQLPAQRLLQAQQLEIQKRVEIQKQEQERKKEELQKLEQERLKKESAERTLQEGQMREYQNWRLQHNALVDRFLEITERKVSLLDDYGDENWDALPKEIETCLLKSAQADNHDINSIRPALKGPQELANRLKALSDPVTKVVPVAEVLLLGKYIGLKSHLESEFRSYHEGRKKRNVASEFKDLSGVEFEAYLAKVLQEHGFEDIRGTPATGDQGADLVAKRNGRAIVIQAKRYQGSVGNHAVQEVVGAINFYGADEGWVITSGTFTSSAKELAQRSGVKLIDGHALRNREFM